MPCFQPWKGFRTLDGVEPGGKPRLTNNPIKAINSQDPMTLPCGRCNGCLQDRKEQWALRCYHESQMHEYNSFITLTYSNEHLPDDYSVSVPVFQNFMKRLRKNLACRIRFFGCGEYGDADQRPHYHALIFGYCFPDRQLFKRSPTGDLYTSEQLTKAWPFGHSTVGNVDYGSAKYVAGYVMKKTHKATMPSAYWRTHPLSGSPVKVEPEFALQSRRPGIGASWFSKFKSDCFPSDFLVIEGRQVAVPRYYTLKLEEEVRRKTSIKRRLKAAAPKQKANRTKERLAVREEILSRALRAHAQKRKMQS